LVVVLPGGRIVNPMMAITRLASLAASPLFPNATFFVVCRSITSA
jgi:hypothetical protein